MYSNLLNIKNETHLYFHLFWHSCKKYVALSFGEDGTINEFKESDLKAPGHLFHEHCHLLPITDFIKWEKQMFGLVASN